MCPEAQDLESCPHQTHETITASQKKKKVEIFMDLNAQQ